MRKPIQLMTSAGELINVDMVRGKAAKQGYRARPAPGRREGLLFIFGRRQHLPDFTMTGVKFGLDLVLLDRQTGYPTFTVTGIQRLMPNERRIEVRGIGVGALELAAGEAERLGIVPGSLLAISW